MGVGAVFVILKPWEQGVEPEESENVTEVTEGVESSNVEPEMMALDVNGAFVQSLIAPFYEIKNMSVMDEAGRFYNDEGVREGNLSVVMMTDLALENLRGGAENDWNWKNMACRMPERDDLILERHWEKRLKIRETIPGLEYSPGEPDLEWLRYDYNEGCRDGESVRAKIKEIFGKNVTLTEDISTIWTGYDAEYDEFYENSGRGGMPPSFEHVWEKAETDGERIYIEETVAMVWPNYWYDVFNGNCSADNPSCEGYFANAVERDEDGAVEAFVAKHRESFDHFRWIFKRSMDGKYYFEKLEKI